MGENTVLKIPKESEVVAGFGNVVLHNSKECLRRNNFFDVVSVRYLIMCSLRENN